ncbi:ABC transporter substrate-binding protein [bacterium]|nr:ABC transporter substrate-binding protein [bacterium]
MKRNITVFIVAFLTAVFLGCGQSEPEAVPEGGIIATDDAGRTVVLSATPERVVSTAPDATETIYAIAPEALVGRSAYCNRPSGVVDLPVIGDFSNPDAERIAALRPDLVIVTGMEQAPLLAKLDSLGIQVYVYFPASLEELGRDFLELGRLLGNPEEGGRLADELERTAAEVGSKAGEGDRPQVYIEICGEPPMTACSGSLIHDLVTTAGGVNVFNDLPRTYHNVPPEKLLVADPDVVLLCDGLTTPEMAARRTGWKNLNAVVLGRVHTLDPDLVLRAGPRTVRALRMISSLLHPNGK